MRSCLLLCHGRVSHASCPSRPSPCPRCRLIPHLLYTAPPLHRTSFTPHLLYTRRASPVAPPLPPFLLSPYPAALPSAVSFPVRPLRPAPQPTTRARSTRTRPARPRGVTCLPTRGLGLQRCRDAGFRVQRPRLLHGLCCTGEAAARAAVRLLHAQANEATKHALGPLRAVVCIQAAKAARRTLRGGVRRGRAR
jgi:hypothetical protein